MQQPTVACKNVGGAAAIICINQDGFCNCTLNTFMHEVYMQVSISALSMFFFIPTANVLGSMCLVYSGTTSLTDKMHKKAFGDRTTVT